MSPFRARITSNAADPSLASRTDIPSVRNIFETPCRNSSSSSTIKIVAPSIGESFHPARAIPLWVASTIGSPQGRNI